MADQGNQTGRKESTLTFIIKQFTTVVLFSLVVFFIQKCFQDSTAAKVSEDILTRQNFAIGKKETLLRALDIVYRHIAYTYLIDTSKRQRNTRPNSLEMNQCMVGLYIYSTNQEIPKQFKKLLGDLPSFGDVIIESTKFYQIISKELGGDSKFEKDFQFIIPTDSVRTLH